MSTNIIPTPQSMDLIGGYRTYREDEVYEVVILGGDSKRLHFAATFLVESLFREHSLHFNVKAYADSEIGSAPTGDILVCDVPEIVSGRLAPDNMSFLRNKNGWGQSYIIESVAKSSILLCGQSDLGCLYAAATLLQLFHRKNDEIAVDNVAIQDRPVFRFRGNAWYETRSYDREDGIGSYRRRIVQKLDMALRYKINLIKLNGSGWGVDDYREYAPMMRMFNREARLRGITLMQGGYGSGRGGAYRDHPELYKGRYLENRRSYPDGAIYACIGDHGRPLYGGTCLSNEALRELTLEELRRFVEEVEPGAVYLHQIDEGLTHDVWETRCPTCRKRWPSDDIESPNGMAGAFSAHYNDLVECVKSVRKPGFDADQDCLIMIASPGYMGYACSDEEWAAACEYWLCVSTLMKHTNNVMFGFRELFHNHDEPKRRTADITDIIREKGNGHSIGIHYFYGGDSWQSDRLFLATAVLNYMFEGADLLLPGCGHEYQEPLQLLHAEYMWNTENSSFYNLHERPKNYSEFLRLYLQCQDGLFRPHGIFGAGGFLETACKKLYGLEAGPAMSTIFSLGGARNEPPVPYLKNRGLLDGEMRRGEREGSVFEHFVWGTESAQEKKRSIRLRFEESLKVTLQATHLLEGLVDRGTPPEDDDVAWYYHSLKAASEYIHYVLDYMHVYEEFTNRKSDEERDAPLDTIKAEVKNLRNKLIEARNSTKNSVARSVEWTFSAVAAKQRILNFVEENLVVMERDIGGL